MTDKKITHKSEQDFVYNGRKDWKSFVKARYIKENVEIEDEELKREYTVDEISKKHHVSPEQIEHQIKIGMEDEKEHTADPVEQRTIASQHLWEKPDFYTVAKAAGLEEEKKRRLMGGPGGGSSIIRPNLAAGATPPDAVNGPGTVSPTSDASGPAPGTSSGSGSTGGSSGGSGGAGGGGGATEESAYAEITKDEFPLRNKPQGKLDKQERISNLKTLSKDQLVSSASKTAEQYIRAGEANGLEGMGMDGYDFIMDHLHELSPEQHARFNQVQSMMEENKKLKAIKQAGSQLERKGNQHMPPAKRVIPDKRDKLQDKAQRYDESENRSQYFKKLWKNQNNKVK